MMGLKVPALALTALAGAALYWHLQGAHPAPPASMGGFVAPGFDKVLDVFRQHIQSGLEKGASFAAYHRGQLVVSLWGGTANALTGEPWTSEHIMAYHSCTKGLAAILVAMYVDRGLLDYDAKVAKYWPEFGQNGKENVTVRQLVSHQAGLAVPAEPFEMYKVMLDIESVGRLLERQKPNWPPGQRVGYHILTFGMLIEYLLYRVDPQHRRINRIFREEVAIPYNVDIHLGLPSHLHYRHALLDYSEQNSIMSVLRNAHLLPTVFKRHLFPNEEDLISSWAMQNPADMLLAKPMTANLRPERLAIPLASSHGFGTAEQLAKIWAIVANGGHPLDSTAPPDRCSASAASQSNATHSATCSASLPPLFSPQTLAEFTRLQTSGPDLVMFNVPLSTGLGVILQERLGRDNETYHLVGHPGYGGQMAYADLQEGLAFAYLTNHLALTFDYMSNPRFRPLYDALHDSILQR